MFGVVGLHIIGQPGPRPPAHVFRQILEEEQAPVLFTSDVKNILSQLYSKLYFVLSLSRVFPLSLRLNVRRLQSVSSQKFFTDVVWKRQGEHLNHFFWENWNLMEWIKGKNCSQALPVFFLPCGRWWGTEVLSSFAEKNEENVGKTLVEWEVCDLLL